MSTFTQRDYTVRITDDTDRDLWIVEVLRYGQVIFGPVELETDEEVESNLGSVFWLITQKWSEQAS